MKLKTALLALVMSAITAYAQGPTLEFLTPAEIDPSRLLPPPPKDGSDAQQLDMAALKRLLKDRTPERLAQAHWDNDNENSTIFASAIGPAFNLKKLPATAKLLAAVENDQKVANNEAKAFFHRKLAAVIDTSLVPLNCYPADFAASAARPARWKLGSYPSGHATMGYSVGIFLAALIPEKSQAILERAADYAYSREVCGQHYGTDIEASHALGSAVGIALLKNAALQPLIKASKAELWASHLSMHQ